MTPDNDYGEQYGQQLARRVKSDPFALPDVLVQLAWPVTVEAKRSDVPTGVVKAANSIVDYYQRKTVLAYIREMLGSASS